MTANPSPKWTDEFLDRMRTEGDPLADDLVEKLFSSGTVFGVWDLMKMLVDDNATVPVGLPAFVLDYLHATSEIPPANQDAIVAGQRLFERCGPEILMSLGFYSLPASYAARKGVQVLYRTGYLNNRPNHRVYETTQMVTDVMTPGGLGPKGRGVRTAQKIRLIHASTRRLLQKDPERPWPEEFGTPINQEDLAGTLMVFTHIIMDGLDKLGISTTPEERQGYMEAWKVVARIIGIREELIPATMDEAKQLCDIIQQRQVAPSPEGKAMNDALLGMMEHQVPPGPWRGLPAALMRHFLPPDVADSFAIPHHHLEERLVDAAISHRGDLDPIQSDRHHRSWLLRKFYLFIIDSWISLKLGGERTPFIIPTSVHHGWAKAHTPGIWEQLFRK